MNKLIGAVATVALLAVADQAHAARDQIWAVGSSTVFPFSTRVAENFAKKTGKKSPRIEALGTGGGIKMFCGGAGEKFPDIANASRQMKKSEFLACQKAGVKDIVEIKIGFDGIVVASNKKGPDFNFKLEQLYLGLADQTLRGGQVVKQPYKSWSEVGPGLPNARILAYGPPPTSGTRDAWIELAIEGGAGKLPTLAKMKAADEKKFKATVSPMRTDGGWVDAGENDNAIVGTIEKTPNALGVFGYSFLEENGSRIKGASINGVKPTAQTIASGQYPLSRSLYIYVKKSQVGVTPGLKEFVSEFVSDAATGRGGYLQNRGMIPLPPAVHIQMKQKANALTPMPAPKN
ncbi:substrate-binding domain-containing protein [Caulobacter vibrioides]|uniref:Phosphate ABC transporter, periplasmic phosphate-binding protein PstS, putative n=2 Tax=Caulobacter vibrioides TaxID=155892 RepID=Q9A849_CAUVC|nr:substrate-binding domain-containing protein [Caulobacter vibrioides]YP_002516956.1 phosphate-binding protein [Caulobacter vibrioides NA1000]AAK23494.1 phosphate ABC transporter, periplasmic phosphate-binding protein PstS, putative [Caulobacter vibrioides CB15]ACL95048.1 phosphate-binding protein [Caulobacter vibrioides NA1000]ATC28318.1 phosphate ABC transporter substrate-binding protein [Caulobacter vibrioides]QXZ53585.1 substrate-binding domain-containing protein [Caulobacter vibrioides]